MRDYYCNTCQYYSADKELKYKNHTKEGEALIEVEYLHYGKCHLNPPTVTSNGTMWPRVYAESDYCSYHDEKDIFNPE
jgi:hypothetical protein